MPSSLEQTARDAAIDAFGEAPDVVAAGPGAGRAAGQPHRLQRRARPRRGDRPLYGGRRPAPRGPAGAVRSANLAAVDAFPIDAIEPGEKGAWGQYVRGVTGPWRSRHGPLRPGSTPRWRATSRSGRGSPARRACRRRSRCSCWPPGSCPGRRPPTSTTRSGWSWRRRSGGPRTPSWAWRRACSTSSRRSSAARAMP